jgi:hypothetical protein
LELAAAHLMGYLPITDETGDIRENEIPSFKSGDEALAFAHERYRKFYKARDRYEKLHKRTKSFASGSGR